MTSKCWADGVEVRRALHAAAAVQDEKGTAVAETQCFQRQISNDETAVLSCVFAHAVDPP